MKVLSLRCSRLHAFEGWFGSEDDFQSQLKRGLVECPMCADNAVEKMPSAPRLNLGGPPAAEPGPPSRVPDAGAPLVNEQFPVDQQGRGMVDAAQAERLHALRQVLANTEDVGQRFADEARRMHYGEAQARSIRGQASAREAVELLEEGIEVMPLSLPAGLKETLQ